MRQVALRERDVARLAEALHQLTRTRWADVTLTANVGTTTVANPAATPDSTIIFDPLTAHAAAELAAGTIYVLAADRLAGSFTITHANNAQTDRTFRWLAGGD